VEGGGREGITSSEWEPIKHLDLRNEAVPCAAEDALVYDTFVPHRRAPNKSPKARRALFLNSAKSKRGAAGELCGEAGSFEFLPVYVRSTAGASFLTFSCGAGILCWVALHIARGA